jgi:hypothetical protein
MKNVHHHLQIIEHDPLAGRKSINRHRFCRVLFFQLAFNFIRDRLQLRLGGSRADHKKIGEGRNPAQVQDNDVFRLFVRGEFSAGCR